jgi:putative hemolysin
MIYVEIGIVLVLIGVNGFLAMSEIAVVSARRGRLRAMAEAGSRGAATALRLTEDPGRFLSSVQIGITLVGVLAGVFSGATIAQRFEVLLENLGLRESVAEPLAYGIIVVAITYVTLIVGELVPKQIALRDAERRAAQIAGIMAALARGAAPLVWFLDTSSRLVLRLAGLHESKAQAMTEEEVKTVIAEAARAGVVEPEEREMIAHVLRLGDRSVRAIMTPRPDVDWIDVDTDPEWNKEIVRASRHSWLPAARGSIDQFVGAVSCKALLDAALEGRPFDIAAAMEQVPAVPDTTPALAALETLRASPAHMIFVVDEHGSFEGMVTATDMLGSIVGVLPTAHAEDKAVRRADGSWLLDGAMDIGHAAELIKAPLPLDEDYNTVAGFVMSQLKQIPETGDSFEWRRWRFEVVDMDGRRVDKVMVQPLPASDESTS